MSTVAIALLIIAGAMHAGWNLVGKRSGSRVTAFLYASVAGWLLLLPVLVVLRSRFQAMPPQIWLIFVLTGLCQTVYFTGLALAYKTGALSLVYPIARSIPVLAVALISLALGDVLETAEITGCVLVFVGCVLRAVADVVATGSPGIPIRALLMATVAAAGTTGYTLLDYHGLALMRATGEFGAFDAPLLYLFFQLVSTTILMIAVSLVFERRLRDEKPGAGISMGLAMTVTYAMVLAAMAFVTNVSSVAAFRQLSIVFGAAFAVAFLRERLTPLSIASIAVIMTGMVLLAIA
jgi:drug/metabolite transporter (DMT)-like permease